MTLYLDTSALVALCLDVPVRGVAIEALAADDEWCTGALTLMEALSLAPRISDEAILQRDFEDAVRLLWDRFAVVPVDQRCLDRATALMRDQPLRLADALHLAAADRLPRPVRFVTFDAPQIPVALGVGFEVVSA
jgi:predicted nucleic acid-binding protein